LRLGEDLSQPVIDPADVRRPIIDFSSMIMYRMGWSFAWRDERSAGGSELISPIDSDTGRRKREWMAVPFGIS
jgi:hypothetical protein